MEEQTKLPPTHWTTAHPVPVGWMRQFRYFAWLYDWIKTVPGDIVECGLGEGNTFAMLAYLLGSEVMRHRKLWGFDSFEGWPEPTQFDASPRNPKKGEWKVSEEMVTRRLEESELYRAFPDLPSRIEIRKGFLKDTLPLFPDRRIAFLHIDVDLYEGYRDALQYLFPKVSPNGYVVLDEYREFPKRPEYGNGAIEKWPGCSKAVDEYFQNRSEKPHLDIESGKYHIVKIGD